MTPIYQLSAIQQRYNGRDVLNVREMTVERGEILALVGPSGAGKSTLLRLLNFLEPPAGGQITFENHPVRDALPLEIRRRVTTVFQRPVLLQRSVVANLRYGLELRREKFSPERQAYWLEKLGLTHLANQLAVKLSAGEAQRVALARALLVRPDVLLLDEPTANLDPYNVSLIEEIVREENAQRGVTVVLVTHNVFQARRLAHRTGLLLNGELIELGETTRFFTQPKRAETGAFVRGELVY
ncbi:MAG: ATP-binding cassette domain-containing protein [Anaerolineales bacterium]|nr:ATP-binding cassette domain-containing protein [Anaerolineales bacterium]